MNVSAEALERRCPRCGAKPGRYCHRASAAAATSGWSKPVREIHAERTALVPEPVGASSTLPERSAFDV